MKAGLIALSTFVLGIAVVPVAAYLYLRVGAPPVAVTDPAFPMEAAIVHIPLHARIDREMPKSVPITASEANSIAGAAVYRQQCAACHGVPGTPSEFAKHMYPVAPQLWQGHRAGVVGVSDDPVGETYWRVKNGIRLSGMPAYAAILTDQQMWQVSMLLSQAAAPLSPAVQATLATH